MTDLAPITPRLGRRRLLADSVGYLLLWGFLTGAEASSWLVGVPTAAAAAWLSGWLVRRDLRVDDPVAREIGGAVPESIGAWWHRDRLVFLGVFALRFFHLSFTAGLDVAARALGPSIRLDPGMVDYQCRLPPGVARFFFMIVISLIPGTLTADQRGDTLIVHVLDRLQANEEGLRTLEEDVARLFGLSLAGSAAAAASAEVAGP